MPSQPRRHTLQSQCRHPFCCTTTLPAGSNHMLGSFNGHVSDLVWALANHSWKWAHSGSNHHTYLKNSTGSSSHVPALNLHHEGLFKCPYLLLVAYCPLTSYLLVYLLVACLPTVSALKENILKKWAYKPIPFIPIIHGHRTLKTPHPVRSAKLTRVPPS